MNQELVNGTILCGSALFHLQESSCRSGLASPSDCGEGLLDLIAIPRKSTILGHDLALDLVETSIALLLNVVGNRHLSHRLPYIKLINIKNSFFF